MWADLNVKRFDQIAAPEAHGKGPHVSEYDRAQVVDEQDIRRKRIFDGPVENERHAAIQQWNTPSTFGVDARAAGLEDRWGGQGHRAGMRVNLFERGRGFQGNSNHHDHGKSMRNSRVAESSLETDTDMPKALEVTATMIAHRIFSKTARLEQRQIPIASASRRHALLVEPHATSMGNRSSNQPALP